MNRKRDKLANWFRLGNRSPKQKSLPYEVSRRELEAEIGAETVGISELKASIRPTTDPAAESKPSQDQAKKQDADHGPQDRMLQSVWQMAWESLPPSDRLHIEAVVETPNGGDNIFSDLEQVAHWKKQDFHRQAHNAEKHSDGKDAVFFRLPISRIITCLRRFKEVGDIAVNFDPAHAALPWAALRFVLEALTVKDEQRELLFSGLERVSFLSLRVRFYEKLYISVCPEDGNASVTQLRQGLVELCREMLVFMAMAIKRFSKTIIAHTMTALFDPSAVSDVLTSINFKASEVDIEASNCERFLNLQGGKKLKSLITEELINIDARIEEQWVRLLEAERSELLQWLSPIPYASDHEFAKKGRINDTGSWLLGRREFREWERSEVSEIFWLHGIPGAGKTKLTSKVIDYADTRLDKRRNKEAMAYFYCDRNRSDHQDPASIVRSFIRQLSADTDNDEDVCKIVEERWRLEKRQGFSHKELPFETCKELLPMLVAAHAKTIMVLDGLDECDKETRHELVYLFKNLTDDPKYLLKIFISSREDRDLFKDFINRTHLRIQANDNDDDIRAYVLAQLQYTPNSWFRENLSPELKLRILQNFSEKSDGMFQWAVLQMHDLLKLKRASDVKAYLGKLPMGLEKAYERILHDIGDQAGSAPVIAARALRWIMDSARPLSPAELTAAVCNSSDDLMPHDPDVDTEFVLEACHNLVVIMGSTCRFAHLSVQEYLENHDWPNKPDVRLLGAVCLHLLTASEDIYSTAALRHYATGHWHKHLADYDPASLEATNVTGPLLSIFFGNPRNYYRRRQSYCHYMPPEWSAYGEVTLGLLATVARCIRDGILNHNLRTRQKSLLHLAVQSENLTMCSQLLQAGANVNYSTADLETPLLEAVIGQCQLSIIELLVEQPGIDVNYSNGPEPPLMQAVINRQLSLIKLLVKHPGIDVNYSTGFETPLLRAVLDRQLSAIKLLVKHPGINADKGRDQCGAPALCNAIAAGDLEVVELLLDAGANPDLMDGVKDSQGTAYNGFTPALHVAANQGRLSIVRALIQRGADVNLVAGWYQTPLANAVYNQHEAVVECLIQNGADVNLFYPLYQCLDLTGERVNAIVLALIDGGALDYVMKIPRAEWTELEESYEDVIDWLDEGLSKTDTERRKRRLMRMFDAGALRTVQGDERGGSERGGYENEKSENADDRSVRSF